MTTLLMLRTSLLVIGLLSLCAATAVAQPVPPAHGVVVLSTSLEAHLTEVRGDVEVTTDAPHPGRAGEVLGRGARIRTRAGGWAVVALANGATATLDPRGLLVMFASPLPAMQPGPPSTISTLVHGTLHLTMVPGATAQTEAVPINTLAAMVFAGRADAMFAADLGGHIARIGVYHGRLRVRTPVREYILPGGLGVYEEEGRPPPPFRLMPRAPTWRAAPPPQVLSLGDFVDVAGTYGPANRGVAPASWRVQVARDEHFNDVVSDTREPASTTQWRGHALAPGDWFVRVFGNDIDRFESAPSPVAHINVAAPGLVDGAVAVGATPGHCAAVIVPPGFSCGLDGAPPAPSASPLSLIPGRAHRLRCAPNLAGRNARESTISAEQSGPLVHDLRATPPVTGGANADATGVITVLLHDAVDRPVSWATLTATGTEGVSVENFHETNDRGSYNATVRWPGGVHATRLTVNVNGAVTFDVDVSVTEERVTTSPVPLSRDVPRRVEVIRGPVQRFRDPDDDDDDEPQR